jgi:hypothetical protein
MSRFAFPDLVRAFHDGERFGNGIMRVVEVDHLVLPTGRVVACDPGYLQGWREPAYTRAVPPGRYPVVLSLLGYDTRPARQENVACAMVRFHEARVERWEMALRPGWDPSELRPGERFGYGVDGGRGCFVDEWAVARLPRGPNGSQKLMEAMRRVVPNPQDPQHYYRAIQQAYRAGMPGPLGELYASFFDEDETGHPARSAVLDPGTGANIVTFPSGFGDGLYASYFGLGVDGTAACLVTDFGLLVRPIMRELELPVPVQEHSQLTHPDLAAAGVGPIHVDWEPAAGKLVVRPSEEGRHPGSLRFDNRPGQSARLICTVGPDHHYRLDEPLQPTARLRIQYVFCTEAL